MKLFKYLLAAGLLAASPGLRAQNPDEKPYQTKSFPADGFRTLRVLTSGGNVTVTGQSSGEARIEMYVRGNNSHDQLSEAEIKERLEKYYDVDISKDATTVNATAKRKQNIKWSQENALSISFGAYVPAGVATDLKTSGGNVLLQSLSGEQQAATSGGNIEIRNGKGNAVVRTSGGNIDIDAFNGTLDAITSGGNIEARDARGGRCGRRPRAGQAQRRRHSRYHQHLRRRRARQLIEWQMMLLQKAPSANPSRHNACVGTYARAACSYLLNIVRHSLH
jgi:hypothetical protein